MVYVSRRIMLLIIVLASGVAATGCDTAIATDDAHRADGNGSRAGGCMAGSKHYPEGAVIDLQVLKGIQSLSVTPALYQCRNGQWVNVPSGK